MQIMRSHFKETDAPLQSSDTIIVTSFQGSFNLTPGKLGILAIFYDLLDIFLLPNLFIMCRLCDVLFFPLRGLAVPGEEDKAG